MSIHLYFVWDFIIRRCLGVFVTQTRSPCDFITQFLPTVAWNTIASRLITKKPGLCSGSAAAKSVAKLRYKTRGLISLWVSGAAVPPSVVEILVPSLKSKHICPPDRKMSNEVTSFIRVSLVVLFSPKDRVGAQHNGAAYPGMAANPSAWSPREKSASQHWHLRAPIKVFTAWLGFETACGTQAKSGLFRLYPWVDNMYTAPTAHNSQGTIFSTLSIVIYLIFTITPWGRYIMNHIWQTGNLKQREANWLA